MKRLMTMMAVLGIAGAVTVAEEAKPTTLADVVKAACQDEVSAKAEYLAFAAKADEEGYKAVSALFRAAAESENNHVLKHEAALKALKVEFKAAAANPEVKTTKENLDKMIKDKTALKDTTHPAAVKLAAAAKNERAALNERVALSFKGAMAANGEYIKYASDAVKDLDAWKAVKEFYVCTVCSFVMTDPKLEKCPICAAPRAKFEVFK